MAKQHDEIIRLLTEIRDDVEALHLRIDESENNMFEVTGSISADLRRIIKKADIKKKKRKKRERISEHETSMLDNSEWPIGNSDGLIQESDQPPQSD